jgi:multidrug transporter EmrE-like cation transporter
MNTLSGIALILLATMIAACGALLIKLGSRQFQFRLLKLIMNLRLVFGAMLYLLSSIPYLLALQGMPVSIAYPLTSATYVWVALLSKKYLKEHIDAWQWTGMALIVGGIILLGW